MAYKHMNQANLEQLLQLLNTEFGKKVSIKAGYDLSKNDFTDELKTKLDGIEAEANKYVHATHTEHVLGLYQVQVDGEGHVVNVKAVEKSDITALGIPGQDTTYVVATQEANGLMSADDKKKLDGVETGANKYVHATHTEYVEGFYKITVDGEGHVTAAASVTKQDLVTLLGEATLTEAGLMSAEDKTKLEGIAAGAQVNVIEEIQVNGTKVDPNGKSVNISVPTGALASKSEVSEAELEETLKKKINDASTAQHSHTNKDLLDTYTQTEEDLADAVSKKHSHANKEELDKIAAGDKAKWDAAEQNAKNYADGKVKDLADGQVKTNSDAIAILNGDETTAGSVKKAVKDLADGQVTLNKNAIATLNADESTEGSVKKAVKDYCDAKVSSAYKAGGTKTYETLPEPAASVEGYVYNVSNDFTTDSDFVEGAGHKYKAGTNVVIIEESEGVFKYDVLAMSFDGFVQEKDISEFTEDEINAIWNSVFTA